MPLNPKQPHPLRLAIFLVTVAGAFAIVYRLTRPTVPQPPSPTYVRRGPTYDPARKPSRPWVDAARAAPEPTTYHEFAARTLSGAPASYLLYLPAGYDAPENQAKQYPVIYWLHGYGASPADGVPGFVQALDHAIRAGKAPPVIAVLPNGLYDSWYCDAADGSQPVESVILNDLIPHVDATYRTIARREGRAVEGFSMGGWGAGHLAFAHADLFAAATILSSPVFHDPADFAADDPGVYARVFGGDADRFRSEDPAVLAVQNKTALAGHTSIRILIGAKDPNIAGQRWLHRLLADHAIAHDYLELPGAEHQSSMYYRAMGDDGFAFYRTAFQESAPAR